MKTTGWYPGTVKPVRVGVYQRRYAIDVVRYSYWNGREFYVGCQKIKATRDINCTSDYQNLEWRGVVK